MESPELHAWLPSLLTWHWIAPFVKLGNKKVLQKEDLYELIPGDKAIACEELWIKSVSGDPRQLSVWRTLFRCFGRPYFLAALWKPVWLAAVLTQVYVLKALVHLVENRSKDVHWWHGMFLVITIFIAVTMQSIAQNNLFSLSQRLSMKVRTIISMAVHDKLLSMNLALSNKVINEGKLLNLISNDTQKLVDAVGNFHFAWFSIFEILVVSAFIIMEARASGVPGVVFVLLCQPIPIVMSSGVRKFRMEAIQYTDERVRMLGDLIAGIKTIKFNGWTDPFLQMIGRIRDNELYWIRRSLCMKFLILVLKDGIVPIASMLIFCTSAKIHGHLSASMSFSVLALLGILSRVLNFAPTGIQYAGEALAAAERLQCFLRVSNYCEDFTNDKVSTHADTSVSISKGNFSWNVPECKEKNLLSTIDTDSFKPILKDINLTVRRGQIVGITGAIGSGKSSLLLSLIGETNCLEGACMVERPVAYAPQQPWIFNDTIRNNILFGSKYDPPYYEKVKTACCLDYDIEHFSASDDTEIGDRGVNLSGGQKARISLARACFSSAQLILLDDPFAALDPKTVSHLSQYMLRGILQGRTVVLTTQNYRVLDCCDKVFMMDGGTLQQLPRNNQVLKLFWNVKSDNDKEEDREIIDFALKHENFPNQSLTTVVDSQISISLPLTLSINEHKDAQNLNISVPHENSKILDSSVWKEDDTQKNDFDSFFNVNSQDLSYIGGFENSEMPTHSNISGQCVNEDNGISTTKEDRIEGLVAWKTLKRYFKAGRYSNFLLVFGTFICTQAARVILTYWLAVWVDNVFHFQLGFYAGIYACIIAGATLFSASRAYVYSYTTCVAANTLHREMTNGIFYSPLLFFQQNFSGRVLNRLSKDQASIDELLPITAQNMLENIVGCMGSIFMITALVPWFLLTLPPFISVLFFFQRRYTAVSRELKRLDGISRSPISAHFLEALQGLTSIRAYKMEENMNKRLANLLDRNNSAVILFQHVSRWLSFRLDLAAAFCVTVTAFLVVMLHDHIAPGIAGVILVQSLQLTGLLQYGVRMAADTENHFTSVERICAYTDLQGERPLRTAISLISDNWPTEGRISFINLTMAYREDLPPVLNEVSFEVRPKEKIGLMGRTGSGKSSLVLALFRLVDNRACNGSILIDGIDIKDVGINDLRQRLSIVPQDPILFNQTIRMNLDPFERHTDTELVEALKAVQLFNKIRKWDKPLDAVAGGDGIEFSVGERQLLCLARAILRRYFPMNFRSSCSWTNIMT
ncbi:hypothetical protein KP509_23G061900 [Ceratopteris richardii]|uniref:Uncharacterized protein n=1 Tax=Ceratopteris richardii TaxID=49495 RepID=A0A8T2S2N1_CERRI|nr:hypothetical protein KP509_23G061900 [Ceratopteris richardii]